MLCINFDLRHLYRSLVKSLTNHCYTQLGALMMAAACWSRTETIVLVAPVAAVIVIRLYPEFKWAAFQWALGYLGFCVVFTLLWNVVFFKFYFPVVPEVKDQINWAGSYSWQKSSEVLSKMNSFVFSTTYWGYFIYIFLVLFLVNLLVSRRLHALWPLAWIVIFYLCFFIMLHHFTLMNVEYTFRRAIMKLILMLCLMTGYLECLQKGLVKSATSPGSSKSA